MRVVPFVLAAVLGVAAAALVSCGGNRRDLIPPRSADRMKSALSDVRTAVHDGDCEGASRALSRARGALLNLPRSVDDRLVTRLRQGISRLEVLAPRECVQETQTTTPPTTETTTPETTPTETTTTPETTPTETTTTPTTTTDTTPTTPPTTTTTPAPPAAPPADTTGGAPTP